MGANTFFDYAKRLGYHAGDFDSHVERGQKYLTARMVEWPSAKEAFDHLGEEDLYENGHSYSGGIGMKRSFTHIATVDNGVEAAALAEKLIEEGDKRVDDKRGPAGCITIREGDTAYLFFGWASS